MIFEYTDEDAGAQNIEGLGQGHTASRWGWVSWDLTQV